MPKKTLHELKTSRGSTTENSRISKASSRQEHLTNEIIQIDGYYSEDDIIKNRVKYHPNRTRHVLAMVLIISLIISIFVFGILFVVCNKEMLDGLKEFSRYAITILSSLTGTAIGFFFGRDGHDR